MSIHTVATVNGVSSVNTVVDTGDLFDKTISGGQIGEFYHIILCSHWMIIMGCTSLFYY